MRGADWCPSGLSESCLSRELQSYPQLPPTQLSFLSQDYSRWPRWPSSKASKLSSDWGYLQPLKLYWSVTSSFRVCQCRKRPAKKKRGCNQKRAQLAPSEAGHLASSLSCAFEKPGVVNVTTGCQARATEVAGKELIKA